jgi:hypothetical protein
MKTFVINAMRHFGKFLGLPHSKTIFIEGGLGSQILSAIAFWNLQAKLGPNKAICDLSYFDPCTNAETWSWQLDNFGISKDSFKAFESRGKLNMLISKKDWVDQEELDANYWFNSRNNHLEKFDFDEVDVRNYFLALTKTKLPENFGAVHIRRGDYLVVASKIVENVEYLDLLSVIGNLFPSHVMFISDSVFLEEEKQKFSEIIGINRTAIFLDSPELNSFQVHCILRMASLLVTSKSTYSFSAGLLGKSGQKVFSPLNFHAGKNSGLYNATFRATADFVVWKSAN